MKKADQGETSGSDPVAPTIAALLNIVPVSRWNFARIAASGELVAPLSSPGAPRVIGHLADELIRQRLKTKLGPRIAATLGSLDSFESGVTMIFADEHAQYGILTMLRTPELGPFTSSEVSILAFGLDALTDRLAELRLLPIAIQAPDLERGVVVRTPREKDQAVYVLDHDLRIMLSWCSDLHRRTALEEIKPRPSDRLPRFLESEVRRLTKDWPTATVTAPRIARPVPFLVMRAHPLDGLAGQFIGLRLDRFQPPNSLTEIATRFHISPRETQVLALLLDGNHLDQIGARLHITSSTVQDHINKMLEKTASSNRSELIARVLGWESAPSSASDSPA